MSRRILFRSAVASIAAFGATHTSLAAQQTGQIVARALDSRNSYPAASVAVTASGATGAQVLTTNTSGVAVFTLPPGSYALTFSGIGYSDYMAEGIVVTAGESAQVVATMEVNPESLQGLVITASRGRVIKEIDGPNVTVVIDEEDVRRRASTTPASHLEGALGVDQIEQGVQSRNVVIRGFNNIFSGAVHTLTDNRIAGIPSLRVNLLHFIPANDDDIEQMEVVLGPGSALYGPNTANGVVHLITKSPLTDQGTTFSIAGGERELFKGTFRSAHLLNEGLGVKVSGQFFRGLDWLFQDPTELAARAFADANPATIRNVLRVQDPNASDAVIEERFDRIGIRDRDFERISAEARADWRVGDAATLILQTGVTSASGIELTGIGAGRTEDWLYSYYQARFNYERFFAQLYFNKSDAGGSFLVRQGAPLTDNSEQLVGQVQHGFGLGETLDSGRRQDFTYGVDMFLTTPKTEGNVNGQYEAVDDIDDVGAYLQSRTHLSDRWEFVAAGRVDKSTVLPDAVWSPRAALLFKPSDSHTFRATYNRAFSTPTTLNYFLDINGGLATGPAGELGFFGRALGPGEEGLRFQENGALLGVRSPFTPAQLGGAGQILPADPETLWPLLIGALSTSGRLSAEEAALLGQLPVAGIGFNLLDPATGAVTPAAETVIPDTPPLEESITNTFEVGYQGLLSDRVKVAADVYYTRRENFTSPLLPRTPLVLFDGNALTARLVQAGLSAEEAAGLAAQLGEVPVGVATSDDVVTQTADIVASYINFGELDYFGADLAVEARIGERWRARGAISWIEDDFFLVDSETDKEVENPSTIDDLGELVSLNAPSLKWSAALGYETGPWTFEGKVRYADEFGVNSADFVGLDCLPISQEIRDATEVLDCADSYHVFDVNVAYDVPRTGAQINLNVSNVFDEKYQSFVGVPEIGRLAIVQLRYAVN